MHLQSSHRDLERSLHQALKIYIIYRLMQILAIIFFFSMNKTKYLGAENPILFLLAAGVYAALCLTSLLQISLSTLKSPDTRQTFFIFFFDVVAIVFLVHFSGGIYGSLGVLLVVIVAASAMFLRGRWVPFIPAFASLLLLTDQIYLFISMQGDGENFANTGILGMALFGISITVQQLAKRLQDSQKVVTKQAKQVSTLEQINAQVIERMPNGVIVVDDSLVVTFLNTSAWRILEQPKLTEKQSIASLSKHIDQQVRSWIESPKNKAQSYSIVLNNHSVHLHFAPLDNQGQHSGTIIFIENASLLAAQAQKMKLASLGTLTAGIAHEIRNPLGAISHAAQLLDESEALDDADRRLTEIIQDHSSRMNRIIENVLQLSRQKSGHPEDIELSVWLKAFITQFKSSQAEDIKVAFSIDESIGSIRNIDASQLSQVLTNLCENGLRYSFAHTQEYYIKLICSFDKDNKYHFIEVIDFGAGINDEYLEHIFEPFFTTDNRGSGLGLYIAKELCENNQSQLSYIKDHAEGSCFKISFSS